MSKFLVIAEKPSVAQSYAKNLSAYKKEDGYLEGESCIVSWCLGHLAEYAQPEEYDPKYEKWQFDDLPILPQVWKLKVSRDKKKQFTELRPFREANTAVAIEISNANRIQKKPTISSMVANFNEFSTTAIGEV